MSISIFGSETPANLDALDAGSQYSLGTRFSVSVAGEATHFKWYFPQTSPSDEVAVVGGIYRNSDSQLLGSTAFPTPAPATGWQTSAFSTPIALETGVGYTAVVWSPSRYVFTGAYPWPKTSDSLITDSDSAGRFGFSANLTFPENSFNNANYFADILFEPEGTDPEGPQVFVWNGTAEISATVSVWNGTTEISATVELVQS